MQILLLFILKFSAAPFYRLKIGITKKRLHLFPAKRQMQTISEIYNVFILITIEPIYIYVNKIAFSPIDL